MSEHACAHPCWHRALVLCGTLLYFHTAGYGLLRFLDVSPLWVPVAWLVSTWLVKHLLQWRCQGRAPATGQAATGALVLLTSAALLTHNDSD